LAACICDPSGIWLTICTLSTIKGWWNSDGAYTNVTGLDQVGELVLYVTKAQQSCCGKYVVYPLYVYTVSRTQNNGQL